MQIGLTYPSICPKRVKYMTNTHLFAVGDWTHNLHFETERYVLHEHKHTADRLSIFKYYGFCTFRSEWVGYYLCTKTEII